MKRYVKAVHDDEIVYTTASGRSEVWKLYFPDDYVEYEATFLDRDGDKYGSTYDTLEEAIAEADKYEAKYQWGLSKQPEFEKWYKSLSPEVKKDFDRHRSWGSSYMYDYESMLDYIDYIKSGRKPAWARSMNLSDEEFKDMTNYDGIL